MKRFVLAAVTVAALGSSVVAQPIPYPVPVPYPVPPPTAVPVPNPDPVPPPPTYSGPPGPAIPFQKSGGRVVGTDGYYPYDTGNYLLGDGVVSRQAGFFTMVSPGGNGPPAAAPAYIPGPRAKHRLFHH
jgi:hypothetical protein